MRFLTAYIFLALGLLTIVLPNSLQIATAVLLAILATLALTRKHPVLLPRVYAQMVLASACVTLFYILLGVARGAPIVAVWQTLTIYIVSPVLWSLAASLAVHRYGAESVARVIAWFAVPTVLSIALYFVLFLNNGPSAVSFFVEGGNVNIKSTTVAARIHAYATLIFLAGGVFAAPEIFRRRLPTVIVPVLIIGAVFTSGRSALLLAVPIGASVFMAARISFRFRKKSVLFAMIATGLGTLAFVMFMQRYGLSITDTLNQALRKTASGGGAVRWDQARALLESVDTNFGLGAGHGIGVSVIRSDVYPWRYELIWIATLHRVGFVGAFVYALPFLLYVFHATSALLRKRLPVSQRFFFGGFLAAFVSSATNPYIEGFVLQWMFIIPVVVWYTRGGRRRPDQSLI